MIFLAYLFMLVVVCVVYSLFYAGIIKLITWLGSEPTKPKYGRR
mgnify:CR=1 FL=1